jgi:hypothetical protein
MEFITIRDIESPVESCQQDEWLIEHIEEIEKHIRFKLIKTFKLSGDDLEEVTSRAILEAVTKVRAKAFVPVYLNGWGDDPVVILKQVKARLNGFLIDEVKAFNRGSSGRGVTDFYDRYEREGPVEDEEGNLSDIWEAYDNSYSDIFNSYAPSTEDALLHKEVFSIIEAVAQETGAEGQVLLDVILGEVSLKGASVLLKAPKSTLSRKKSLLVSKIKVALIEAGYDENQ